VSELATKEGFSKEALSALPSPAPFVADLRARAFEEFEALPIPSQETEEWRYTDLSALDLGFTPFSPAGAAPAATLDEVPGDILAAAGEVGDRAGLRIQHNSEERIVHLDPAVAAKGVVFCDLDAAAAGDQAAIVEGALHALVPSGRTKFTALHGAFRSGGSFLFVPPNVKVELPIQTLVWMDADGGAVFPHTLIVAGEHAEVTFIDRLVSPDLGRAFSDAVVEIHAGAGSKVRYVSLQEWGRGMTHLSVQRARLGRDAEVRSLSVSFGADLSRTEFESVMAEPGGFSEMLGLYFADESQHFDHRTLQDHVAPNCTSDLLYKGALKGSSRTVYSGWVIVRPDAQQTNAFQTNRNIVLSDKAKADAIPNLEIEANDVKCGHAASVGPVDDETLFYLESRGIPRAEAERLIVTGFFQEVIDKVALQEVQDSLAEAIDDELARE
jgi:Fe-S cluster assembly protein SufD